jgi:hypothetical protein
LTYCGQATVHHIGNTAAIGYLSIERRLAMEAEYRKSCKMITISDGLDPGRWAGFRALLPNEPTAVPVGGEIFLDNLYTFRRQVSLWLSHIAGLVLKLHAPL